MNIDGHQLQPKFSFGGKPEVTVLDSGPASLDIRGTSHTCEAEVNLRFAPEPRLAIDVRVPFGNWSFCDLDQISNLKFRNRSIEGFASAAHVEGDSGDFLVSWVSKNEPILGRGDDSTEMVRVVFHLFNFTPFIGSKGKSAQKGKGTTVLEGVDFEAAGWDVDLWSTPDTREQFERLKAEGGFRLTHVGSIKRTDGGTFSGGDVSDFLGGLRLFFSFAKGCWCYPVCPVGFDEAGTRVWESWLSPRGRWRSPLTWFDPHHPEQLVELFPKFMDRWNDENWRKALNDSTYWYLNANDNGRGIDAGIILSQAALERLGFEFCVVERRLLEREGFKKLWASDKFRLLFSTLRIPLDIPDETPDLQRLSIKNQMNWLDAPHALTGIRNSLVHPEKIHSAPLGKACPNAWKLSLWYLEMSMLAICGYSGPYANRLKQHWVGQIEDVPWSE